MYRCFSMQLHPARDRDISTDEQGNQMYIIQRYGTHLSMTSYIYYYHILGLIYCKHIQTHLNMDILICTQGSCDSFVSG